MTISKELFDAALCELSQKVIKKDSIAVEDLKIGEFCYLLTYLSVELERVKLLIEGGRMTSEEIKEEMGIIWVSSASCKHASNLIKQP